jgi:hypothetical protein
VRLYAEKFPMSVLPRHSMLAVTIGNYLGCNDRRMRETGSLEPILHVTGRPRTVARQDAEEDAVEEIADVLFTRSPVSVYWHLPYPGSD